MKTSLKPLIVTAIYDSKVKEYSKPYFFRSREEALRSWMDVVNKEDSDFHRHPEDYTMFELAEFSIEQGAFKNHEAPVSLGTAHTLQQN